MRVEQLIGNYSSLGNRKQGKKGASRPYAARCNAANVAVLDVVCLSSDEFEQDLDWFGEYVRQIPDEVVKEKVRQLFGNPSPSDDFLAEKLLFDLL